MTWSGSACEGLPREDQRFHKCIDQQAFFLTIAVARDHRMLYESGFGGSAYNCQEAVGG